jgi:hypothetical protein
MHTTAPSGAVFHFPAFGLQSRVVPPQGRTCGIINSRLHKTVTATGHSIILTVVNFGET